jgi:hypothetical protein
MPQRTKPLDLFARLICIQSCCQEPEERLEKIQWPQSSRMQLMREMIGAPRVYIIMSASVQAVMKINSAPLYYCDFSEHLNTSSGVLAKSFCTTVTSRGSGRKSKLTTSRGVIFFAAQKKEHTAGWPRSKRERSH